MSRVSISRATLALALNALRRDAQENGLAVRGEIANEIEADVREIPGGLSPTTPCQGHAAQQDAEGDNK